MIAAAADPFDDWIADGDRLRIPEPDPSLPVTWIVTPTPRVSPFVCGDHARVAVRITTHTVARELPAAIDALIISISANVAGRPVARNAVVLRRRFSGLVDYIVPGRYPGRLKFANPGISNY